MAPPKSARRITKGVSLKVHGGSVTAVLGRNGMGKTTLIRSIIGFNPPRKWKIYFKGVDITTTPAYKIARMGIGLVPPGPANFSLSQRQGKP